MKAGVVHCRCSKCFSIPTARKRVRRRAEAQTLLSLPEEVLLCVLQCLSAEDLLAVRAVHSQLKDIVDNHSSVWARVSFRDTWPDPKSVWLFERAAEKGNFEAAVKLGIAYLYNEGPLKCDEGQADVCGRKASHYFSLAEALHPAATDPFTWVFIRPPWSLVGSCCKAVVFHRLKAQCEASQEKKGPLLHSLARVLLCFDDEEMHTGALAMLKESAQAGCLQSSYLLWDQSYKASMSDPGRFLQSVRTLRDYAAKGCWEAQLSLAKVCLNGNPLGLEGKACVEQVAQFFSSSPHAPRPRAAETLRRGIKDTMRYILVDWLVEVTTMKSLSSLTLQVTVGCVDRYLGRRSVPKARLQLLGIACMVVCTRYTSRDILTIREAVWLTDNTYKYEDLVRMMGEVMAVLEGKIRTPMLLDYGKVLLYLLHLEWRTVHLFKYICELSLLHSAFATAPPAKLACAVLLLSRALHHYAPVWPRQMVEYTSFSKQDLTTYALQLYVKCFSPDVPKDYRHVSLTAVKQRFDDEAYQQISLEKVVDFRELCQILEVPEVEPPMDPPSPTGSPADIHTFLCSPSSNNKRRKDDDLQADRGTPTAELSPQEETLLGEMLDWSLDASGSGYEGDLEESELERDGEASVNAINLHEWFDAADDGPDPDLDRRMDLDLDLDHSRDQDQGPDRCRDHCRSLSSAENSFCEAERGGGGGGEASERGGGSGGSGGSGPTRVWPLSSAENSFCEAERGGGSGGEASERGGGSGGSGGSGPTRTRSRSRAPLPFSPLELQSSGYASIHCSSSSPTCSYSALVPCAVKDLPAAGAHSGGAHASPGFRLLVPMQRPAVFSCKQVKRKNAAAHSGGEMEVEEAEREAGFLSL